MWYGHKEYITSQVSSLWQKNKIYDSRRDNLDKREGQTDGTLVIKYLFTWITKGV